MVVIVAIEFAEPEVCQNAFVAWGTYSAPPDPLAGFGMQSGFISRCVRARLQVSVCIGYDLFHPG